MKITIKSLNDQQIRIPNEGRDGLIDFPEISMKSDCSTEFEFDDNNEHYVKFTFTDANGQKDSKEFDLSKFGLDVTYIIDKIKPVFEKEYKN